MTKYIFVTGGVVQHHARGIARLAVAVDHAVAAQFLVNVAADPWQPLQQPLDCPHLRLGETG